MCSCERHFNKKAACACDCNHEGELQVVSRKDLDHLVRNSCFAADNAAMDEIKKGGSGAQVTKAAVERAFEFALGNGLIKVVEAAPPRYLVIDPPYAYVEAK